MSRVLVADGDDVVRVAVTRLLQKAGHDVTGAASAEVALSAIHGAHFDVIVVSDIMIPVSPGSTFYARCANETSTCP